MKLFRTTDMRRPILLLLCRKCLVLRFALRSVRVARRTDKFIKELTVYDAFR